MEACTSGCILSSLFYEQLNSQGDSEGLLLGETTTHTINTVSDSQAENIRHDRQIVIQGFVPCPNSFSFYDRIGRINSDFIQDLLKEHKQEVIGWYRFRRNTETAVSLRERIIHLNLLKYLNIKRPQEFLLGIFTSSVIKSRSTHSHEYKFFSYQQSTRIFESVHLNITNLGPTTQSGYDCTVKRCGSTSETFEGVLSTFRSQFLDNSGCIQQVSAARLMYENMVMKLKELANEVRHSESDTAVLASEVQSLREILAAKRKMVNIQVKNIADKIDMESDVNDDKSPSLKSPKGMEFDDASCSTISSHYSTNKCDQEKKLDKEKSNSKHCIDCDDNDEDDGDDETQDMEFLSERDSSPRETFTNSPVY